MEDPLGNGGGFNLREELEKLSTIQLHHYLTMSRPLAKRHVEIIHDIAVERSAALDSDADELLHQCTLRLRHLIFD